MRILLTGGNGMVGRNFLEHQAASGHDVLAPRSHELDLRDYQAVCKWMAQYQPDLILHAAGKVGGIEANMREPVNFLVDNLDIGRNVVLAAQAFHIPRLLNLSSSCVYPRDALNPLREEAILTGTLEPTNEGYALAKIMVARLCEYVSRETPALTYKTIIPCNLFGRHDAFDPARSHMVPAILHKLHEAKRTGTASVDIWGDGTARREFMYAGDLADCLWQAVTQFDTLPLTMNVGLGHDFSVNHYYQTAAALVGFEGTFKHDLSKPVGMKQKLVSVDRATEWGWKAKTSLEDGLARTYAFYLQERNK
jgi:GDP-L-fucose synthase